MRISRLEETEETMKEKMQMIAKQQDRLRMGVSSTDDMQRSYGTSDPSLGKLGESNSQIG